MSMILLNAGYDPSGNPKRVYVLHDASGRFVGAWDDGYSGYHAVPEQYRELARYCPSFQTTHKEYKEQIRRGKL